MVLAEFHNRQGGTDTASDPNIDLDIVVANPPVAVQRAHSKAVPDPFLTLACCPRASSNPCKLPWTVL